MKKWHFLLISLIVCMLDQVTKYLILQSFEPYTSLSISPFLNLILVFNTGSAFSFLSNSGSWHLWFFLIFSLVMSLILLVWMLRTPVAKLWQLLSLSLILGGAVGNFIDRVRHGHVIDFIDAHINQYHWPAFNVADAAICIGAVILLFSLRRD